MWYHGPFAPGPNTDIVIFRYKLKQLLLPNEKVVADKGYDGDPKCMTPHQFVLSKRHKKMMSIARSRHEVVNRRLKYWGCLKQQFRHHRDKHNVCFRAVIVLTQMVKDIGEGSAFDIVYENDPAPGLT